MISLISKARTLIRMAVEKRAVEGSRRRTKGDAKAVRIGRVGLGKRGQVLDEALLRVEGVIVAKAYDKNRDAMRMFCRANAPSERRKASE